MKNFSRTLCAKTLTLTFAIAFLVGCSESNKNISLRDGSAPPLPAPDSGHQPSEKTETPAPVEAPAPTPTPTPAPPSGPKRVARIICETQLFNSASFNTLRADAVSNFVMPSLVPSLNGTRVNYVKSAVPLQSNGTTVFFIMRAQEDDFTPWKIYKATGNLLDSRANLQVLSNYEGLAPKGGFAYENLKLNRLILGANVKRSAYVYPNNSGVYVWESLKGSNFTIPFNANISFNPIFVGGDDYVRFDEEIPGAGTLTQKFFHFDSKKTLSLPDPADHRDSQLFGFVNQQKTALFWVEGRPDNQWKIRMINLRSPGKAHTLGTLPGAANLVRLPMTFVSHQGETLLAYNEEQTGFDKYGQLALKSAVIHLVKVSASQLKITSENTISYSDTLKLTATNGTVLKGGILGGFFHEPISGRLYAPILSAGGLASFNLESRTWDTHGMFAQAFGCFSPEWGVEVTND